MKASITAVLLACLMSSTMAAEVDAVKQPSTKGVCRKDGTTGLMFAVNNAHFPIAHVAESDIEKFCGNTNPISMYYKKIDGACFASADFGKSLYRKIMVPCEKVEKFLQAAK